MSVEDPTRSHADGVPRAAKPRARHRGGDHQTHHGTGGKKRQRSSSPSPSEDHKQKRVKLSLESGLSNVEFIQRPAFWSKVNPLSPDTPLWATVIEIEADGGTSTWSRPLVMLGTQPLPLVPTAQDSIVLDISPRCGAASAKGDGGQPVPRIRFRTTNAGPFGSLSPAQLESAIGWSREALAMHFTQVRSAAEVGPQLYTLLPMVSPSRQIRADGRMEKIQIDWEEMGILDRGASQPLRGEACGPFPGDGLQDKVLFAQDHPSWRLLVERQGYAPRTHSVNPRPTSSTTSASSSRTTLWSRIVKRSDSSHREGNEQLTLGSLNRFGSGLRVMFLSTSLYRSTSVIPAISWALEDALLSLELSQQRLDGIISARLTAEAITLASATSGHIEGSCERLEILGDAVLRLICNIDRQCGSISESKRRASSSSAIGGLEQFQENVHLAQLALEAGLLPYIRREPISELLRARAACAKLGAAKSRASAGAPIALKVCETLLSCG